MGRLAEAIIRHRKLWMIVFIVAAVVCAVLIPSVKVKYNMVEYLPSDAQSTKALELLSKEFSLSLPDADVTVRDVSLMEALAIKKDIAGLPHISEVLWLDDVADLLQPIEMGDKDMIETFYKDRSAFYSVTVMKGNEKEGVREIRALLGENCSIKGDATEIEFVQTATGKEVINAFIIMLPLILLILVLSTTSWIEPLLFLAAIGVSVVINMGTNLFLGGVSFLTNAVTPILQLAVSLDYAIFLLHSFGRHRKTEESVEAAMKEAIKESFSAVAASASTTLFGFMALLFMDFKLGADLGLSLAKGIVFSFVSVIVFLPALTLTVYKGIDKTHHREFMPSFSNVHNVLRRLAIPAIIVVAVIIVPCFLAQSKTDFLYGYQAAYDEMIDTSSGASVEHSNMATVLLVPKGDVVKEDLLSNELLTHPRITSVISYAKTVGVGIPPEFLDESITSQFYSDRYARLVVYADTPQEGDLAFAVVEEVSDIAHKYYPDEVYSVGQSVSLYDIRNVVRKDNNVTNIIAIIAIFIVLLLTFRSAILPFLLLLTIEAAIWINLSIPYFSGTSINYVGYLVLNTVQLGATVDYAILLTLTYMRERQLKPKKEAAHAALGSSFRSILISAVTMASAGFALAGTTSNPLVADIGLLLGRGALLSMAMSLIFLPALLTVFDKPIMRTTLRGRLGIKN